MVSLWRRAADAALHAATEAHGSMSSETTVRYERLAMACRLCKGPTSTTEEEMCDECKDDLLIRSCEAICHACEQPSPRVA